MDRYQVVAPYVTVPTTTRRGQQVIGLLKGAFVPDDAPREWVDRHLRKKLIEKVASFAAPAPAPAPAPVVKEPEKREEPQGDGDGLTAPPESGPGSGKQEWVDYAVARGMDRAEAASMKRDDLIAALRED
ncbi:hypothetical protein [Nonomuraea roseoviolacea]|uniref:Uncharacterized protein n=1 Tax=Nonomuraea roseoviolacea subsp. carminata TaxID=160689 RepID=A0ABT1K9H2_9ACTN|nr:hypothetical protein [Nonomuraea roseoviolacea]MCP2350621.1 hypothetical protein [Nonomuraea roseoviolacea subsp. carminata]